MMKCMTVTVAYGCSTASSAGGSGRSCQRAGCPRYAITGFIALLGLCGLCPVCPAEELVLCDFESPDALRVIEGRDKIQLGAEHATQGKQSGKVPGGFTLVVGSWTRLPQDWSGYEQLRLDVFNPGDAARVTLWIADAAGNDYYQRHNGEMTLRPGANTLVIPVGGLYRGEKGSGKFLDSKTIRQMVMSFPKSADGFFLDNFVLAKGAGGGQVETKVLLGFEAQREPGAKWTIEDWPPEQPGKSLAELVAEHVTEGAKALRFQARPTGGAIIFSDFVDPDWSHYDSLELDCFSTAPGPITVHGWFRDSAAPPEDGDYWKRHNYQTNLSPGASTIRFPLGGFYRGEKGSGHFLDTKQMLSFLVGAKDVTLYLDNLRLVKGSQQLAVNGLKAFDFGPKESPVFPGFTAVYPDTAYSPQRGFGWLGRFPSSGSYQEHPDSLFGDYIRCTGGEVFAVDVPNGEYTVYLVLDHIGYWDYLYWRTRAVEAEGKEVLHENMTPAEFLKDHYFLHQDDEELPGADLWQKYIQHHFQPKLFKVQVADGQLDLTFRGDAWGLTLACLALFPTSAHEAGQRWIGQLDARRRQEFYTNWAEVVHKPEPKPEVSADEQAAGFVLFQRDLAREISYNSAPGGDPADSRALQLNWLACAGEYEAGDFCVYPLKDCGALSVKAGDLTGANGATIPGTAVRVCAIRYKAKRIGGRISSSYQYLPACMADFSAWPIPTGVTRRFWITFKVPEAAAPGTYTGKLAVTLAGTNREIPVKLEVCPFKLDEPQMSIGMYGGARPSGGWGPEVNAAYRWDERTEEVLRDQKEHGMTAVTPISPAFKGFQDGKARFDYTQADRLMALLRRLGYHHECFTYADMFGVRAGDVEAECQKNYGMPLEQAIKLAYEELGAHMKEKNWLPMAWALADEPLIHGISANTVIKVFEVHRRAAPQMQFVSEDAMGDPAHYKVIPAIDIVSGNSPRYAVAEAVRQAHRRYWLNNIGTDRITFGWFLWKAHKDLGVEALFQWGYSTNHADIYYDLDGMEGDSGCSFTASEGQRPTREWELIRAGANDHRYLQTLANLCPKAQAGGSADAKATAGKALKFCDDVMTRIDLEKKNKPYSHAELDTFKRKLAEFIVKLRGAP